MTIPDGVITIGQQSFERCYNLASIIIPSSVTSIETGAFYDCDSLTSITFNGTMEQWHGIEKDDYWDNIMPDEYTIYCTDGEITK